MGVYYCIFDLYLPFFDSMFGAKRAKKCISDLLASHQWHVKIDGFVSSQLGDTWVPLHYKFIF